ncbi:hypothetical protein ACFPK9_14745 [Rubritalea spongiae]|uniref:DUF4198 domain-containing protein n=1 Tax=Rubritalea spongiae TaxID=430797 RepID=A0ABW5DZ72_9BACT
MSTSNSLIRLLVGLFILPSVYAAHTVFLNTSTDGLWNTASKIDAIHGETLPLGSQGTFRFKLDTLGVTPLTLDGDLAVHASYKLIVDSNDYEAMNGFFPLITSGRTLGKFYDTNTTLLRFERREAALITQDNGLWLRL